MEYNILMVFLPMLVGMASDVSALKLEGSIMSQIAALSFNIEDAKKYGQEEAVILYHIRYWTRTNAANNKHIHDGRCWTYNSHKSLSKLFPFWNEQKCKRLIKSLKDQGAILVGNYNKIGYDRTSWYTINDGSSLIHQQTIDQSNLTDGSVENNPPIPITKYNTLSTSKIPRKRGSVDSKDLILEKNIISNPVFNGSTPNSNPCYLSKSSQWYQHYLKSSINEEIYNSLPNLTKELLYEKTLSLEKKDRSEAKDEFVSALQAYKSSLSGSPSLEEIVIDL